MKFLIILSILPFTLSLPQPQPELDLNFFRNAKLGNYIDKKAFGAGAGDAIAGTSVVGEKDTSTLTSLVVFKPSSTSSSSESIPTSSEKEEEQIVSPFYPNSSDNEEDNQDNQESSLNTLNEGETAIFNPTPSTTLSLLTNNLATSTSTSSTSASASADSIKGSHTQSNAVIAAASASGNSTSSSGVKMNGGMGKVLGVGLVGLAVSFLV